VRRLDELHLEHPFLGSRMLTRLLEDEAHPVSPRHVMTLMHRVGIEAICPTASLLGQSTAENAPHIRTAFSAAQRNIRLNACGTGQIYIRLACLLLFADKWINFGEHCSSRTPSG
jgi:hypothetical protein